MPRLILFNKLELIKIKNIGSVKDEMTKCTLEGNIGNHIYIQVVECECTHTKKTQNENNPITK